MSSRCDSDVWGPITGALFLLWGGGSGGGVPSTASPSSFPSRTPVHPSDRHRARGIFRVVQDGGGAQGAGPEDLAVRDCSHEARGGGGGVALDVYHGGSPPRGGG